MSYVMYEDVVFIILSFLLKYSSSVYIFSYTDLRNIEIFPI
jgi:hypothetical protein